MRRFYQEPIKSKGSTVTVERKPTTRMDTAIALFMPAQVQVSYGATYTDFEIGAGAAIAGNAVTDVMNNMTLSGLQSAASKAAPQLMTPRTRHFRTHLASSPLCTKMKL